MPNFVRQIQRTRMGRELNAPPQGPADPQQFQNLLNQAAPDVKEQNAPTAPGALQKEGSQEQGRQRNVGQGEAQGSPGQGPQVQRPKEVQQGRKMK